VHLQRAPDAFVGLPAVDRLRGPRHATGGVRPGKAAAGRERQGCVKVLSLAGQRKWFLWLLALSLLTFLASLYPELRKRNPLERERLPERRD
jgi:hypothetical protein